MKTTKEQRDQVRKYFVSGRDLEYNGVSLSDILDDIDELELSLKSYLDGVSITLRHMQQAATDWLKAIEETEAKGKREKIGDLPEPKPPRMFSI